MGVSGRGSCCGCSWMMTIWSRRTSNWSWGSRIKISHQIRIATRSARSARTGQGLLQLFFLLAIFGSSILKPYLKQKIQYFVIAEWAGRLYFVQPARLNIAPKGLQKLYAFNHHDVQIDKLTENCGTANQVVFLIVEFLREIFRFLIYKYTVHSAEKREILSHQNISSVVSVL